MSNPSSTEVYVKIIADDDGIVCGCPILLKPQVLVSSNLENDGNTENILVCFTCDSGMNYAVN